MIDRMRAFYTRFQLKNSNRVGTKDLPRVIIRIAEHSLFSLRHAVEIVEALGKIEHIEHIVHGTHGILAVPVCPESVVQSDFVCIELLDFVEIITHFIRSYRIDSRLAAARASSYARFTSCSFFSHPPMGNTLKR